MSDSPDEMMKALGSLTLAAIDMIGRTGADDFQLRFSDTDTPVVWIALAHFAAGGRVASGAAALGIEMDGRDLWLSRCSLDPRSAVFQVAEALVDGGRCTHCAKPTGITEHPAHLMLGNKLVCWYAFDPELRTFRRTCEGES